MIKPNYNAKVKLKFNEIYRISSRIEPTWPEDSANKTH